MFLIPTGVRGELNLTWKASWNKHDFTMPSPMEGSSREGDLFTVKHELKNGKSKWIVKSSSQSYLLLTHL